MEIFFRANLRKSKREPVITATPTGLFHFFTATNATKTGRFEKSFIALFCWNEILIIFGLVASQRLSATTRQTKTISSQEDYSLCLITTINQ